MPDAASLHRDLVELGVDYIFYDDSDSSGLGAASTEEFRFVGAFLQLGTNLNACYLTKEVKVGTNP